MVSNMQTSNSSPLNLTSEIIKPSLYGLTILFIVFIFSINGYQSYIIKKDVATLPDIFNKTLQAELSNNIKEMRIALEFLSRNKKIITSLENKNKKSLFELSEPIFNYLKKNHNITHFYFTGKDRKNILRVHKKNRTGDIINRYTQMKAENSKQISFGIELGPLGTFTLRVVKPILRKQNIIGYIELGIDTNNLVENIKYITSIDSYILIKKELLTKQSWQPGVDRIKKQPDRNRLKHFVSMQAMDENINDIVDNLKLNHASLKHTLYISEGNYRKGVIMPLHDAAMHDVGLVIIHRDYSEQYYRKYKTIAVIFTVFIMLGGLLTYYLYKTSKKTETKIRQFKNDIKSELHKRAKLKNLHQEEINHLSLHDILTGLPGRNLFVERLSHDIKLSKRYDKQLILLILDINRLRYVNDTLGHHMGDELLQMVASRLRQSLRESDTVARIGTDEFGIIFPNIDIIHIDNNINKVINIFETLFTLKDIPIRINITIGASVFPTHSNDAKSLLQFADIAMRQAKKQKSEYVIYDADKDSHSLAHLTLLTELQDGIKNNELVLFYQPQTHISSNKITDVEALVRWQHPQRGLIPPVDFIELAEKTGLIKQLTFWVINEAFSQSKKWHNSGLPLKTAINISANNLHEPDFIEQIKALLKTHSAAASWFTLEITESAIMASPSHSLEVLKEFKKMGFSLSIDDFGTGYSSLAYLREMPVNELKIDQSFISNFVNNNNDNVIVNSTINLGHNLGLSVIAEGVEDKQTFDQLKNLGCDFAQGYFISRPLPANALIDFLKAYKE